MFEGSADGLVGEIADSVWRESVLMAQRCAAIAALLALRTAEAEAADPDPGWSMITGFARTTAEVSAAMNMTPRGAQQLVAQADALDTRLPTVAQVLAGGRTDWRTVEQIVKRTELVDDAAAMATLDTELAERIGSWVCWSRQRIINAVDAAVRAVDPAAAKQRRVRAHDERFVHVSAGPDGIAVLRAKLPAPVAAIVDKQLAQMAKSVCGKDSRTMDQRRADALWALAERRELTCACGRSDCPAQSHADAERPPSPVSVVINVIATEDTVAGDSQQPGYLEGYGVIDADQVRELTATAVIRPVDCPQVSDEQAHRYQPSAGLENWIRCRDLTCRFPGCDRKAWICDIDHTVAFNHHDPAAGGLTVPEDLSCECREHHRLKTFHGGPGGWRDKQLPDGRIEWTSPTGRTYVTSPLGYDLFPQLRQACRAPTPRKRSRAKELAARISRARAHLHAQRPVDAENRRVNYARRREIELRKWRNQSRRYLILFKGEQHSTSPWCTWINDPFEPEELPPDWQPPPPPPTNDNDDPPF
ncbi:HNH nuclease [Mycobacterium sp. ACS1612]|uniref:HNH endonuclease signature motif containing protein n=1 Tax=Mycobacterium sp. ACS1612 TaxID=1834117 RepID=UPI0007FF9980|nr:HNH endonuclease signature motif containing protein [Mycobacterium sp. ACS1612]OBF31559.1 HNH nuclease [Mycobacterium sp. ACS1612]